MKATTRYLVLLSMLVVGRGDANGDDGGGDTNAFPETLECGDKRATQYCATIAAEVTSQVCLNKPSSCKSCDCVNVETDLTAQTGHQDCTATARLDVDYIKASCTVRAR